MPRKKGTIKTGGREAGAKNKKTLEWEEFGRKLVGEENLERALSIMNEAPPLEFMKYFNSLLEYFKPKLNRTEITGKDGKDFIPTPVNVLTSDDKKRLEGI